MSKPTYKELEKRVKVLEKTIANSRKIVEVLKEENGKYQDLYDNGPDMFVSVESSSGRVVECNNTLVNATGYSKNEIVGKHISKLYHPNSEKKETKCL